MPILMLIGIVLQFAAEYWSKNVWEPDRADPWQKQNVKSHWLSHRVKGIDTLKQD